METTSEKMASCTLEETLRRLNVTEGTKFRASLYRSKRSGQVIYLEAGKDLVDALLSFLLLPAGTIMHIISAGIQVKPVAVGITRIFESVQNFSDSYLQVAKENLVRPRPAAIGCSCRLYCLPVLSALETVSILQRPLGRPGLYGDFYKCEQCDGLARDSYGMRCLCSTSSSYTKGPYSVLLKEMNHRPNGLLKPNCAFMVTDDLEIVSLTTKKTVDVLSKLKIDSLADVESIDITVSLSKILELLHSALTSNTCLSEVFGKAKRSSALQKRISSDVIMYSIARHSSKRYKSHSVGIWTYFIAKANIISERLSCDFVYEFVIKYV